MDGHYFHDLLPLPFTEESLQHLVSRIDAVQTFLQRQILIENVSSYIRFDESNLSEATFLKEAAIRSGCGILLDINNIYVSPTNLDFDPFVYLAEIPAHLVQEIHLAGFS